MKYRNGALILAAFSLYRLMKAFLSYLWEPYTMQSSRMNSIIAKNQQQTVREQLLARKGWSIDANTSGPLPEPPCQTTSESSGQYCSFQGEHDLGTIVLSPLSVNLAKQDLGDKSWGQIWRESAIYGASSVRLYYDEQENK